ncbi:unnamed protein product, partial [Protopolystoma xenopodis]
MGLVPVIPEYQVDKVRLLGPGLETAVRHQTNVFYVDIRDAVSPETLTQLLKTQTVSGSKSASISSLQHLVGVSVMDKRGAELEYRTSLVSQQHLAELIRTAAVS